jgi:hypothetical protein
MDGRLELVRWSGLQLAPPRQRNRRRTADEAPRTLAS